MKCLTFLLNRIKYLILILFLLCFCTNAKAIVNPTKEFFVNDYAGLLSEDTKNYIQEKSEELYKVDGTQIVVVTVQNLEGNSLEDYANELFNTWKIGDKSKNNGLLLLLALEERLFRVEVGDGLEGILPDGKTGRFQDEYIIPYLKNNNWDEGIKSGYDAFFAEIVKQNNLDLEYNEPISSEEAIITPLVVLAGIVGFFLGIVFSQKYKNPFLFIGSIVIFMVGYGIMVSFDMIIGVYWFVFFFCFFFAHAILNKSIGSGFYYGGTSGGGSSGGFSGGGFSGGGGHSSGGGSSRGF